MVADPLLNFGFNTDNEILMLSNTFGKQADCSLAFVFNIMGKKNSTKPS